MNNVKEEVKVLLEDASPIAKELTESLEGTFFVTGYQKTYDKRGNFETLFCSPTKTMSSSLSISREVLAIIADYTNVQARTLRYAKSVIKENSPRLDPGLIIVVHKDEKGNPKLRAWGREDGILVIPIYRKPEVSLPTCDEFKRQIAADLFSMDPFDITGPVSSDEDFYGRRSEVLELVRQLEKGRIRSFFGIRKIGKTSIINRTIQEARKLNNTKIAMIDCSEDKVFSLPADKLLSLLAKTIEAAIIDGYATARDITDFDSFSLETVFKDLKEKLKSSSLSIIFDEVDYITPGSPTCQHWNNDFNIFWRVLRVHIQESQRQKIAISLLISGVSSMWFKEETINGIENAALHFIPEEYLNPFPRNASIAMIKDIGKRAGLIFTSNIADKLAEECADFPFWIRKAGSMLHRVIDIEDRPHEIKLEELNTIISSFIEGEGGEITAVALKHLSRAYPRSFKVLVDINNKKEISKSELFIVERYGLVKKDNKGTVLKSKLIEEGLMRALEETDDKDINETKSTPITSSNLYLEDNEWAEELATINRRRNLLERAFREFVRFGLKFNEDKKVSWHQKTLAALPEDRRKSLSAIGGEEIMKRLFFKDLVQIVTKNWEVFQSHFGDKNSFTLHAQCINDRLDAHAKDADMADIALYRKSLEWFEKIIMK